MQDATKNEVRFSDMTVLSAEGARVGLVACLQCGSAILIDPRDGATDVAGNVATHGDWHNYLNELLFDMSEPEA